MENKIKLIEDLIINNKLLDALEELQRIFEIEENEDLINETLLILSRLNNLNNKSKQGVLDYFDSEFGKIRLSVINLKSAAKKVLEQKLKHNDGNARKMTEEEVKILLSKVQEINTKSLNLYFDTDEYSRQEIAEGITFLSELYRSIGGDSLIIDDTSICELKFNQTPLILI